LKSSEVAIKPDLLEKILASVGPDSVLVGGQALAIWLVRYGVEVPRIVGPDGAMAPGVVTNDADFLGNREDVTRIAERLHGVAEYPPRFGLTSLVGSVHVPLSASEFVNIDVIHQVVGLRKADVRKHAFTMVVGNTEARVMHPLDVLRSRVENLRLPDKRKSRSAIAQAGLAVLVANKYVQDLAADPQRDSTALRAIEEVVSIAKSSAGRNASREFGISFLDAIPHASIQNENFRIHRLPRLLAELRQAGGRDAVGANDDQTVAP
jgi:hypothetical protein